MCAALVDNILETEGRITEALVLIMQDILQKSDTKWDIELMPDAWWES